MAKKSKDSFFLAVELYNKPTISMRTESFLFFICTAWEMLFKAYLLKSGKKITYRDARTGRQKTITLHEAMTQVINDERDVTRKNLDVIIGLRNSSQHFIIPEYATMMNSLFLANVIQFPVKAKEYLEIDVLDGFPVDFLTLFVPSQKHTDVEIMTKYGKDVARHYASTEKYVSKVMAENSCGGIVDSKLAIAYNITARRVNNPNDADITIAMTPSSMAEAREVKVPYDSSKNCPLSTNMVVKMVRDRLETEKLEFDPISPSAKKYFNANTLSLYIKARNIKDDLRLCFVHEVKGPKGDEIVRYAYSVELVERIVGEVRSDKNIFKNMSNISAKKPQNHNC
jgi:hypothetical protein